MSNKESTRKPNWNLILTGISTIAAVLSVGSALWANRISHQSELPRLSVAYVGQFRDFYDDYQAPCKTQLGYSEWQIEFAVAFDISNLGGKPVSLVDIDFDRDVETLHPSIRANVHYGFFGTREKFDEWLEAHYAPSFVWIERSREKLDCSGPPINVGVGETRRVILRAREEVQMEDALLPQEALDALYDVNWSSRISFKFANGDIERETVRVVHPFSRQVSRTTPLMEFEACSE